MKTDWIVPVITIITAGFVLVKAVISYFEHKTEVKKAKNADIESIKEIVKKSEQIENDVEVLKKSDFIRANDLEKVEEDLKSLMRDLINFQMGKNR